MKTLLFLTLALGYLNAHAFVGEAMETCDALNEYQTEVTVYQGAKEEYAAQGMSIDKMEPNRARKIKALKARYERAKKKFEKENKAKFKASMCQP